MYKDNLTAQQIKDFEILGKDIEAFHVELYAGIHRDAMDLYPKRVQNELAKLSPEDQLPILEMVKAEVAKKVTP